MKLQIHWKSIFALSIIGFILAAFGYSTDAQSPAESKIDYILRDEWKDGQWMEKEKTLFIYDSGGRIQYTKTLINKVEGWITQDSTSYLYDEDSAMASEEHLFLCIVDKCLLLNRELIRYDDKDRKTEQRWQEFKDGEWADYKWKTTIEYNDAENSLESIRLNWKDGQWTKPRKWVRHFDESEKEISADAFHQVENTWEPTWKLLWTRNPEKHTAERLTKSWEDGKWIDYHLDLYSYDEHGNEVEKIRQNQENGEWINEYRNRHFYK